MNMPQLTAVRQEKQFLPVGWRRKLLAPRHDSGRVTGYISTIR